MTKGELIKILQESDAPDNTKVYIYAEGCQTIGVMTADGTSYPPILDFSRILIGCDNY